MTRTYTQAEADALVAAERARIFARLSDLANQRRYFNATERLVVRYAVQLMEAESALDTPSPPAWARVCGYFIDCAGGGIGYTCERTEPCDFYGCPLRPATPPREPDEAGDLPDSIFWAIERFAKVLGDEEYDGADAEEAGDALRRAIVTELARARAAAEPREPDEAGVVASVRAFVQSGDERCGLRREDAAALLAHFDARAAQGVPEVVRVALPSAPEGGA